MSFDEELPIWDHIEELAQTLRRILFALILATVIIISLPSDLETILKLDFSSYRPLISTIIGFLQEALLPEGVNLIAFNWLDTFYIYFIVALTIGTIIILPFIAYELNKFIRPALYPQERRALFSFVAVFTILFIVGALYAYFLLLPTTFNILYRFVYQSKIIPFFSVKGFFNMIAVGIMGSGLFYTFPLVIYMLVKVEIMDVQDLKDNRKPLFIVILIVTAILTPDPSPFSMLLMSVPFYLLYEFTIQILSRTSQRPTEIIIEKGVKASKELLAHARQLE